MADLADEIVFPSNSIYARVIAEWKEQNRAVRGKYRKMFRALLEDYRQLQIDYAGLKSGVVFLDNEKPVEIEQAHEILDKYLVVRVIYGRERRNSNIHPKEYPVDIKSFSIQQLKDIILKIETKPFAKKWALVIGDKLFRVRLAAPKVERKHKKPKKYFCKKTVDRYLRG